jgi:RNA polymerase sigma factor for flagellar operon FliA
MISSHTEFNEAEKERITRDFLPFIKYTAYRFAWRLPPQLTIDDLISVGIVGLLEALTRYREGEAKLNTFVEYRIKGAMLDELRNHSPVPKSLKKKIVSIKKAHVELERELGRPPEDEEVAESLDLTLDDYYRTLTSAQCTDTIRFEDFGDKFNEDERLDLTECIADTRTKSPLEILEEKNRSEMLARRIEELPEKEKLVLSLYYWEEMTMKEIGKIMNLSEGRVCQLHGQAIIRIKSKLSAREEELQHDAEELRTAKTARTPAQPRAYEARPRAEAVPAGRIGRRLTA